MTRIDRSLAEQARAWPFEEARKLVARIAGKTPEKGYVLFETGYGPSGLPHIGTFGEVVRTTMVRQAFQRLSDVPTRLFCFSDDMDGLRKVPDNVPNKEMLRQYLGKPLTAVPDPFQKGPFSNEHPSFGAANNARLRAFLDSFGFEYEFQSATDWYKSGRFDKMLLAMLRHYDEVQAVMLPTLGAERQATYSIFLPISPKTGRVLQVPVIQTNVEAGTIVYRDEDGTLTETPVTGGNVKLQWKADWAGRWFALAVDYEMYGKDLIPSAELSAKIVQILGGRPPEGFNYELFLDDQGRKISKSKGNGLSVEEWLRYAPPESLAYYMFQAPRRAKRLYFDVIPRAIDDYLAAVERLPGEEPAKQADNPAWHIHNGKSVDYHSGGVSFGMLLNLASVAHTDDKDVLWQYLRRYVPGATPENAPYLDGLLKGAVAYYQDFVKASKRYRLPLESERPALQDLIETLRNLGSDVSAEEIQNEVYEVGKRYLSQAELRNWFRTLYEVLLGDERGPRWGAFIKLSGRDAIIRRIDSALRGILGEGERPRDTVIFEDLVARIASSTARIPAPTVTDVGILDFPRGPMFVGPDFSVREDLGDGQRERDPRIILVVAAAATGKSVLAKKLSERVAAPVWDLAKSEPVGGNDQLIGVLSAAYAQDYTVASKIATEIQHGERAILVDSLDEGRISITEESFGAFVQNMGAVPRGQSAKAPVVLIGRRQIIESAWVYLSDRGIIPLVIEIERFRLDQARYFVERAVLSSTTPAAEQAKSHRETFRAALERILAALQNAVKESTFVGYAPVLMSLAAYFDRAPNFHQVAQTWTSTSPALHDNVVELLNGIIEEILDRERRKFLDQAWPQLQRYAEELNLPLGLDFKEELYSPVDQIHWTVDRVLGEPLKIGTAMPGPLEARYRELVSSFLGDHAFLNGDRWSSSVFQDYSFARALLSGNGVTQDEIIDRLDRGMVDVSGLFGEFYLLLSRADQAVPRLPHMSWLYESFKAAAGRQERVEMRLDAGTHDLEGFESRERVECECDFTVGRVGSSALERSLTCAVLLGDVLKLRSGIEDVFVRVPCIVQLGRSSDGDFAASGAVSIQCSELELPAGKLVLRERFADRRGTSYKEEDVVVLEAETASELRFTQSLDFVGSVDLAVGFPGDENHPWSRYRPRPHPNEDISSDDDLVDEAFRRFRSIVTTLRANGYGTLARRQIKVESSHVLKGQFGRDILSAMVRDGILDRDNGLYVWNSSVADRQVRMPYRDIVAGRLSAALREYLRSVVREMSSHSRAVH